MIRKEGAISEKIEIESTAQSCYTVNNGAVFYAEDEVLRKKTGRVFLHNE